MTEEQAREKADRVLSSLKAEHYFEDNSSRIAQALLEAYEAGRRDGIEESGWISGTPNHPYGSEWFLAKLKDGSISKLRALPEDWYYQYENVEADYYRKDWVTAWMQLPSSSFIRARSSKGSGV